MAETVVKLLAAICLLPSLAFAQSNWNTSAHSGLTLQPSLDDNCPLEIAIHNRQTDYMSTLSGSVTLDGMTVQVAYELNIDEVGAERYTIDPPEGFMAVPRVIVVNDDTDATVLICPLTDWIGF